MGGETTFKAVRYICDRSGICNWSRSVREQSSGVEGLYPLLSQSFFFFVFGLRGDGQLVLEFGARWSFCSGLTSYVEKIVNYI
jgi:hypothetical protein